MTAPLLSLVVLGWEQLPLTQRCVASLRAHTDIPYELIIVDNGSAPETVTWAGKAADRAVLNPENLGFAAGMNTGLAVATGEFVAFINNDTEFPPGWASPLIDDLSTGVGIVAPAVTAAGNQVTVRSESGAESLTLTPFGELPSGVVYVLRTEMMRRLGGWNEGYLVATGEDLDLCFTVWTNDLEIVLDTRVLVEHLSRATLDTTPAESETLRRANLNRFLDRWTGEHPGVVRLDECPPEIHARNLRHARAAASWLRRLTEARERAAKFERQLRQARPTSRFSRRLRRHRR